jgi:hypothetical protein
MAGVEQASRYVVGGRLRSVGTDIKTTTREANVASAAVAVKAQHTAAAEAIRDGTGRRRVNYRPAVAGTGMAVESIDAVVWWEYTLVVCHIGKGRGLVSQFQLK